MEVTRQTDAATPGRQSPRDAPESSPARPKETPRQQLSASLRERLRRSRRAFTSPFSVAKRLCVEQQQEDEEEEDRQVPAASRETVNNPPVIGRARSVAPQAADTPSRDRLSREVKGKAETLRRLRMVQVYRSKNDLTQLQTLIDKWRRCAQAALLELRSDVPVDGRAASLSELVDLFGLDDAILHFDRAEEDFTS